jgi:hypothetical protein
MAVGQNYRDLISPNHTEAPAVQRYLLRSAGRLPELTCSVEVGKVLNILHPLHGVGRGQLNTGNTLWQDNPHLREKIVFV